MDKNREVTNGRRTRVRMVAAVAVAVVALAAFMLVLGASGEAHASSAADYWAVCPQAPANGCDYATIQEAVNAAGSGDIIRVVGNNVYTENLVITESLTLLGGCANAACAVRNPSVFVTTVDGAGAGRAVTIEGEGDPITVTVDGFVITGGDATSDARHPHRGGGVGSWNADLTLRRSVITGNVAAATLSGYGGGVHVLSGTIVISYNQVVGNRAGVDVSGEGGGMYLENVSGVVGDNVVRGNVANAEQTPSPTPWGRGGGIRVEASGSLAIDGNVIYSNTAALVGAGYGGGVSLYEAQVSMSGNSIRENVGGGGAIVGYGGGVAIQESEAALSHNWVASNTASLNGIGDGGGAYIHDSAVTMQGDVLLYNVGTFSATAAVNGDGLGLSYRGSLTATNVGIVRNGAPGGAGEAIELQPNPPYTITMILVNSTVVSNTNRGVSCCAVPGSGLDIDVVNTILWGNGDELNNCDSPYLAYSDIEDTADTGLGVIHQNPLFVDAAHDDFHLQAGSPCINVGAGPATYPWVPGEDWDGESRPSGSGYDIGADEFWAYVYLPLVLRNF